MSPMCGRFWSLAHSGLVEYIGQAGSTIFPHTWNCLRSGELTADDRCKAPRAPVGRVRSPGPPPTPRLDGRGFSYLTSISPCRVSSKEPGSFLTGSNRGGGGREGSLRRRIKSSLDHLALGVLLAEARTLIASFPSVAGGRASPAPLSPATAAHQPSAAASGRRRARPRP